VSTIVEQHQAALASDPENTRAFEALQEHLFLEGEWESLVSVYEQRLRAPSLQDDVAGRTSLLFRMAQVLDERCGDVDRAAGIYWDVARLDPQCRPALRQLRVIHTRREQWDMVLQIAEVEAELEMDVYERSVFLGELGFVWLDQLQDSAEARGCFESALEGDPHQQRALLGLARCEQASDRPEKAAELWQRLSDVLRGPERAPVLVSLGKLYSGPLNDPRKAIECFRRAMTDDPRSEEAVESLLIIAGAREQWDLLGDLYERRFDLAAGARHRSAIALEAGNMQLQRREDRRAARSWFDRALELVDDDPAIYHAFAELERHEGNHEALRHSLDRLIDLSERTAPPSLLLEAADLHGEGGNDEKARRYLGLAHEQSPDDPLVLEALSDVLSRTGNSGELAEVLERRAALSDDDPEGQAEALTELGRIYEDDLGDAEAAIDALTRAFDANPRSHDVVQRLQTQLAKTERWHDLRETLERARGQGTERHRAGYACALGTLLLDRFEDVDGARRAYESAHELDARSTQALHGLERIARDSGDVGAMIGLYEREASETEDATRMAELIPGLARMLCERSEHARALAWCERLLAVAPEHREALEITADAQRTLGRMDALETTLSRLDPLLQGSEQATGRTARAALLLERGDVDAATETLEAAIEADPSNLGALRAIEARYLDAQRLQDVARVQRKLADLLSGEERARCLAQLATLLEDDLGDVDGAIVVLWRLCDMDERPQNATAQLEALLERAGRFEELAQQLLERRRALEDASEEALLLDLQRAHLLMDKLGQVEEAARLFRSVRSHDPGCLEATEGLEHALRSSNDSAGLVVLLESRSRAETDLHVRAGIDLERAVILEESLGEQEAARDLYTELADRCEDAATATGAASRLERLLERRGDWSTLRERLERALGNGSEDEDLELHDRLAAICRDRLADREGCAKHLEAIGERRPEHADTWRRLGLLYHELERPDDLLRVLRAEIASNPEAERELVVRARAARLCSERAGESDASDPRLLEEARAHYERVLDLDAAHSEATEFLIDHYQSEDRPDDVIRLLRGRLETTSEGERASGDLGLRTSLRLRIADLMAERLDDVAGAAEILEQALDEIGPENVVAQPLATLYERSEAREPLAHLCRRASASCDDPAERAGWQIRLGTVLQELEQPAEAAEAYCAALADRPRDLEIEATLRDLYRSLGDAAPLAALLETEIDRVAAADSLALRLELSELLSGPLDRSEDALGQLVRALEIDGSHAVAFERALSIARQLDRHEELLALIDRRLDATHAPAERAQLFEQRGDLLMAPLDRLEEAAGAYRSALAQDASRSSTRRKLREVLERLERWSAVLDCLHMESSGCDTSERGDILERALQIARDHLSPDAALPWLERLRHERPHDPSLVARVADVHRQAGRPEALLRALETELTLVTDPSRKRDLHVDRARTLERDLRAPGRAITAYETAWALAPEDSEVLRELDRLYDLMGRTRDRVEVIEARIPLADSTERVELHRIAALLCAAALAEPERAIPHLLHAVEAMRELNRPDTERLELLGELAANLRAADHVDAWVRAAEEELRTLASMEPGDAVREALLHHELAIAYGEELRLPHSAMQHLRMVLQLAEKRDGDSLTAEQIARAEAQLIQRLREDRNHVELAGRLGRRLERGGGDGDEWLELARLRAEQLHTPNGAADAYREALARLPECLPAIRGLRHVSECLGDWAEVVRTLELEVEQGERWSARERMTLHRKLGDISWRRLDEPERASTAYRAALAELPGDLQSLRTLQQLLVLQEEWTELISLYEREIEILDDEEPERRHALWVEVGRLVHTHTEDSDHALRGYEEASKLGTLEPDDQRSFAELYRDADQVERFAETFTEWCDHADSEASSWDHLALMTALQKLGRTDAALERAARAAEVDPENVETWDAMAALHEERGELVEARGALERAADLHEPRPAAERLVRAAALCGSEHTDDAANLLRAATTRDPALALGHAQLARVCEELEAFEEAELAAGRALDLAEEDSAMSEGVRLETALTGSRVARRRERLEEAARFCAAVLAIDPEHTEALSSAGEVFFECGDYSAARELLERRLELGGENPSRAEQLAMIGRGLEHEGDTAQALSRHREALDAEPALALAHEGTVRIHENAERLDQAVVALERWIRNDRDAARRARSQLRVAEHLIADDRLQAAEDHLRDAVASAPDLEPSWVVLLDLIFEAEHEDDALEISQRALEHVEDPERRAHIALIRGRILDDRNEPRGAADAFIEAAKGDPCAVEAALAAARLLRGMGDWYAAAETLQSFATNHPEPTSLELAQVHLERGRLMAGPLENVAGAIECYENAIAIQPDLREAREPLASLLAHVPERWDDAVQHHRELLMEDPTRQSSMRALLEISRRRDLDASVALGLGTLRALGAASPEEALYAPDALTLRLAPEKKLGDVLWETARRICNATAQEINEVLLEAEITPMQDGEDDAEPAILDFWRRVHQAEAELTAPLMCTLPTEALGTVVYSVTALSTDLGGNCNDGPFVHDLDRTMGRWTRRKIRKVLGDRQVRDIQAIDYDAWRAEIRGIAAGLAVDGGEGDLRSALIALSSADTQIDAAHPSPSADITSLVAGSPLARGLLVRVVERWCEEISRSS
jgi:tetratricopeptide (TPR) repeat protein